MSKDKKNSEKQRKNQANTAEKNQFHSKTPKKSMSHKNMNINQAMEVVNEFLKEHGNLLVNIKRNKNQILIKVPRNVEKTKKNDFGTNNRVAENNKNKINENTENDKLNFSERSYKSSSGENDDENKGKPENENKLNEELSKNKQNKEEPKIKEEVEIQEKQTEKSSRKKSKQTKTNQKEKIYKKEAPNSQEKCKKAKLTSTIDSKKEKEILEMIGDKILSKAELTKKVKRKLKLGENEIEIFLESIKYEQISKFKEGLKKLLKIAKINTKKFFKLYFSKDKKLATKLRKIREEKPELIKYFNFIFGHCKIWNENFNLTCKNSFEQKYEKCYFNPNNKKFSEGTRLTV